LHSDVDLGARILKVNHAGEHGAVNIYLGQRAACWYRDASLRRELADFQRHEERHRAVFEAELKRRGAPRCRSYHLCGFGGFILGFLTGLCGRPSISAVTVAVERVVLKHLNSQIAALSMTDPEAVRAIASIVAEEQRHLDQASLETRRGIFWPRALRPIVSLSTEAVIWVGMHL
jgi:3-demethoxyubiquinol 3-hydroxylase